MAIFGIPTPELGISEFISDLFGAPRNPQGGSNLFGQQTFLPTSYNPSSPQGQVSGANTFQDPGAPFPINPNPGGSTQTSAPSNNNVDQGGGGGNPFNDLIESAFNAKNNLFNQIEGTLRGQQPQVEEDIRSLVGESRGTLETEKGVSEREIAGQEKKGARRKEDAITAARRLFNDLQIGGQQRFGSLSSAGEAFKALSGREFQRNAGDIERNFSDFMGQIEGARINLRERFESSIKNLEAQKVRMLNEARRAFQDKLLQIDQLRAAAQEDKANARLGALQDLRNQVFQIDLAAATGQQQINQLRSAAEQQIQNFQAEAEQGVQRTQAANTTLEGEASTDPATGLVASARNAKSPLQLTGPTGRRREEEDLFA